MAIRKIKVSNFKTFKDLDLELGNFNVVIGANASGKSNFTRIFKFLRNLEANELKNAISMNGGLDSIRNIKIGLSKDLGMKIVLDTRINWRFQSLSLRTHKVIYEFSLSFDKPKNGYRIANDQLTQKFEFTNLEKNQREFFDEEFLRGFVCTFQNNEGNVSYTLEPQELEAHSKDPEISQLFSFFELISGREIPPKNLLIQAQYGLIPPHILFGRQAIYNLDPHRAKDPAKITGKAELEEDGNNLAIILNNIIENEDERRKLCNLVKDLLPFVKEVGTEKFAEKSLMITLQEDYYADENLRADLLSDGTVNITALIVALYFEEKDVVIIEEPERNIHPHLISRLIEMMKEASKKKQIIVTTHSPEVVKHAGLDNLLLISRDNNGFSHISRPGEKKEVKVFLENELGLDELYIQDLLGAD